MQNRIYSGNAKARGYGTFCCDGSTSHWTNLFKNIFGLTGFGNQLSSDYTFCDFFFGCNFFLNYVEEITGQKQAP
jgi:hypothetical protein